MNQIETEPLVSSEIENELQIISPSTCFKWKSLCRIEVAAFLKALELGLHNNSNNNIKNLHYYYY